MSHGFGRSFATQTVLALGTPPLMGLVDRVATLFTMANAIATHHRVLVRMGFGAPSSKKMSGVTWLVTAQVHIVMY